MIVLLSLALAQVWGGYRWPWWLWVTAGVQALWNASRGIW